jgi:hypothetical protein
MDWLKIGLAFLKAYNMTVALLKSWRDREAGKKEVTLAVKENSDDAVKKADAADSAVSERIAAGRLRDDDGYKRD